MPERYHIRKNGGGLAAVSRVGTHRQRGRPGHAQVEASARYVEEACVMHIARHVTLNNFIKNGLKSHCALTDGSRVIVIFLFCFSSSVAEAGRHKEQA